MVDERHVDDCTDEKLMESVVRPAVERIFKPGEIDDARLVPDSIEPRNLVYRITVGDEEFEPRVREHEFDHTVEFVAQQFFDDLQDYVAESSFAWGELRGE
ncbi:hypothetical protein D3I60_11090 [Brevibacterium permense]|uniref:hypothetical protein n=1 Tax=Brevibacterium permense TaxID=234834 RepID=UPI0021D3E0C6|nr:hypothetical protein [Brevibacterium permense]MCU4297618.1 hypothetical protein [Brevibacterium permense]